MSLTRIYSGVAGLGQLIIRQLGDVGGPPAGRVSEELDRIIGWAKDSGRTLRRDFSTAGNVGAGADVLHSFTLPGNSLATNGDYLKVEYQGLCVDPNTFQITVQFDGVTSHTPGLVATAGGTAKWSYSIIYARLSSTSLRCKVFSNDFGIATPFSVVDQSDITVGSLANDRVMRVLGEVTTTPANDEVTQNLSIIELYQQ